MVNKEDEALKFLAISEFQPIPSGKKSHVGLTAVSDVVLVDVNEVAILVIRLKPSIFPKVGVNGWNVIAENVRVTESLNC